MLFHPYFRFPFNCLTPSPDINRQQKMTLKPRLSNMTDRDKASRQIKGPRENRSYEKNKLQTPNHEYIQVYYKKIMHLYTERDKKKKDCSKKIIRALDKIGNIWKSFTIGGR